MSTNENSGVIQPYLFFDGRCEEALEFYKRALGAEVLMLMRYKESPEQAGIAQGTADKVMHARFRAGQSIILARHPTARGAGAARNHGASLARGEYLVFLDGDDVLMPWALDVYRRLVTECSPELILGR